jgi:hypothetical protein
MERGSGPFEGYWLIDTQCNMFAFNGEEKAEHSN